MKAITFSYDDGVTQDIRLAKLFHKYGVKATFNLNSGMLGQPATLMPGRLVDHSKVKAEDVKYIYEGHEVAAHTLTHPILPRMTEENIIRQVEEDRLALSSLVDYDVVGFAYPGGGVNFDTRVANVIKANTGIRYCRTIKSNGGFDLSGNLYEFEPTVYHMEMDKLFSLGEEFLSLKPTEPKIFYVWGHAYEFDIDNTWDRFEEFLSMMAGKDDIFYGTNKEVLLAHE